MNATITHWLKGLVGAVVTGCSTSALSALGMGAGEALGMKIPTLTFKQILIITGVGGAVGMCAYLKQSPVPPDDPAPKTDGGALAGGLKLLLLLSPLLMMGCASVSQKATTTSTNPTNAVVTTTTAKASAFTLFDAKNTVDKMRASAGKTSSVGASGVAEESSSMALKALLDAAQALIQSGALKSAAP